MAQKIPYKVREQIVSDRKSGLSYGEISQRHGYSISGVKKIWYRYQKLGEAGLPDSYANCGSKLAYHVDIRALISSIRAGREGALYIRSILEERYPNKRIPHERTIQRWWKLAGVNQPKGRPRKSQANWTSLAHEVWQIDGKEKIKMGNGEQVSWLNIVDEGSKAQLSTELFPREGDGSN